MDAVALAELLQQLVLNADDDDRLADLVVVPAVEAGLGAMAPAFLLQERDTGRQWVVSVARRGD